MAEKQAKDRLPGINPVVNPYVTQLSPLEELSFRKWIQDNQITDLDHPDSHYDYRGFWKRYGPVPVKFGQDHFTDEFKQPGHPTFSQESIYSRGPYQGGMWVGGDTYLAQPPMATSRDKKK